MDGIDIKCREMTANDIIDMYNKLDVMVGRCDNSLARMQVRLEDNWTKDFTVADGSNALWLTVNCSSHYSRAILTKVLTEKHLYTVTRQGAFDSRDINIYL